MGKRDSARTTRRRRSTTTAHAEMFAITAAANQPGAISRDAPLCHCRALRDVCVGLSAGTAHASLWLWRKRNKPAPSAASQATITAGAENDCKAVMQDFSQNGSGNSQDSSVKRLRIEVSQVSPRTLKRLLKLLAQGIAPGILAIKVQGPVKGKPYILPDFKSFALTGRQVCVCNNPGRCPGLGATALSGRGAYAKLEQQHQGNPHGFRLDSI